MWLTLKGARTGDTEVRGGFFRGGSSQREKGYKGSRGLRNKPEMGWRLEGRVQRNTRWRQKTGRSTKRGSDRKEVIKGIKYKSRLTEL